MLASAIQSLRPLDTFFEVSRGKQSPEIATLPPRFRMRGRDLAMTNEVCNDNKLIKHIG